MPNELWIATDAVLLRPLHRPAVAAQLGETADKGRAVRVAAHGAAEPSHANAAVGPATKTED